MTHLTEVLKKHKENNAFIACAVGKWLDTLTQEEAEAFIDCIEAPNVSAFGLYTALSTGGIQLPFKQTVFRAHVKGYCVCQR
jgi:hypothetical protein